MSDYYWNEFIKLYVDEEMLKDTLKYHQRTINKWVKSSIIDVSKVGLLQADILKTSEIKITEQKIDQTSTCIKCIFNDIKKIYEGLDIKVSIPVFIVLNNELNCNEGVYSLDIQNNKILLIKMLKDCKMQELSILGEEYSMIISFFLNIEQAIALYGANGYIKGIEEIGYLIKTLSNDFRQCENSFSLPEQEFTHDVGINLRKCLLIDMVLLKREY